MTIATRIGKLAADPAWIGYRMRAALDPEGLWRRQERLWHRAGLDRPAFVLSFDCDTEKDIRVVEEVHGRLAARGITPVYAVPGELLERGAAVYRRLHDAGADFINHGYAEHSRLDEATGVYESLLFYDRMTPDEVRRDIEQGDAALRRVLGITPTGFRTPHFGSFQRDRDLEALHRILAGLGYRFSSSSLPLFGCRRGAWRSGSGVWELPVTGCRSQPLRILDSWGFRSAPDHRPPEEFIAEVEGLRRLLADGRTLLVNLYADPSQVHDWPEFFDAMAGFAPFACRSYETVLESLAGRG